MKYLIPADLTADQTAQHEQEPGRSAWYPWLGLALVVSTAAVTYGALAFFLID